MSRPEFNIIMFVSFSCPLVACLTQSNVFVKTDSDYLLSLVNLFNKNPNRLHYESNFLNDINFLQSTNFLGIWVCNLSILWWHETSCNEAKQFSPGSIQLRGVSQWLQELVDFYQVIKIFSEVEVQNVITKDNKT